MRLQALLAYAGIALVFVVAACGGPGGNGVATGPTPTPQPASPPPPPPAPSPTPAPATPTPAGGGGDLVAQGEQLANEQGCLGCHTTDGTQLIGPTWQGLYGSTEQLEGGQTVQVDEEYLRQSIVAPGSQIVAGFQNLMPSYADLSQQQLDALIAYIRSLSQQQPGGGGGGGQ